MVTIISLSTGTYADKDGRDMRDGGGTLFFGTEGRYVGPGDAGEGFGNAKIGARYLAWDTGDWPVLTPEHFAVLD